MPPARVPRRAHGRGDGRRSRGLGDPAVLGWLRTAGVLFTGVFLGERLLRDGEAPIGVPEGFAVAWFLVVGLGSALLGLAALVFALRAERMADGDLQPLPGRAALQRARIALRTARAGAA